jgi:hypothetical protein
MHLAPVGVECVFLKEITQAANPFRRPPIMEAPAPLGNAKNKPPARKM